MNLHVFYYDSSRSQRDSQREKEKYPIIFPFEEACDISQIRQFEVITNTNMNK